MLDWGHAAKNVVRAPARNQVSYVRLKQVMDGLQSLLWVHLHMQLAYLIVLALAKGVAMAIAQGGGNAKAKGVARGFGRGGTQAPGGGGSFASSEGVAEAAAAARTSIGCGFCLLYTSPSPRDS